MGPNPVWLAEALAVQLPLSPGMRVLDLGCGRATTSIFLAKEFEVRVWAADLWIAATDNWERVLEADASAEVFPLNAEAHALPFADGFFDAIVSIDAYHYFGTADLYLSYLVRFLRPGGWLGIVVPGLVQELTDDVPDHLRPYWEPDCFSLHSPEWWRRLWTRSGHVAVELADLIPDGWRHWVRWNEVCAAVGDPQWRDAASREAEMVRIDAGRTLGFARVVARKPDLDPSQGS